MAEQASSGTAIGAGQGEPLTFEQVVSWERVGDPQISPDGEVIAFTVKPVSNDEEHPKGAIWLVPFDGGDPHRLTGRGSISRRVGRLTARASPSSPIVPNEAKRVST